jgi:hypothetical protein
MRSNEILENAGVTPDYIDGIRITGTSDEVMVLVAR